MQTILVQSPIPTKYQYFGYGQSWLIFTPFRFDIHLSNKHGQQETIRDYECL